jgi:cellulose synthase/poly-beta-1,6-N-acetylglucosamine synthase-like glycosyltransferase/glycosyltransferase involved in cell wall biosynthesis
MEVADRMNWFAVISAVLLSIILGWAIYHVRILFAGIRNKSNRFYDNVQELPKFSIIVPAKDEGPVIARCLDALLDMEYPREKMEIIVVEGTSKDSTKEICQNFAEKHPASIKILCEKASNGKPAALNLALPHVTGEIVGVFDADSIPEKSALQKMVSYFQDKAVTAVQGSTTSLNAKQNMLTQIASMEDRAWFQGLIGGREKLKLFVPLTGSCQFIRSDVLKEMGGWDESSLAEDVELALKLTEKGHLVKFAPDISSGQETPSKIRDLITQRMRWYRGYMEAAFKHGRLAEKRNRKIIDAELSLIGPFIMVICFASYFNWAFSMVFSVDNTIFPISATLVVALTSLTLLSLGVSLVFLAKPVKLKNIFWVPFVYLYWLMQMTIASWAFLQILFRRRRVWGKTAKIGFMTPIFRARSSPELRVAFVSSYPPNHARLSEYAQSLVNELSNRPAIGKMYLLVDQAANAPENLKEDPKVKILRVWKADDFLSIIGILKHLIKLRPHVVHFNVHFQSYGKTRLANFTGLSLIFLSRLLGFKVLAEIHNLGEKVDLAKVQLKPSLLNKVGILVATKLILSAPRVVVTVRSYADYLKERYGHLGVQYIPHGTLAGNYSIVDPEEKIILLFGHMGPYKGLPVMLNAFKEMRKENYNVKLIVAGSSHPNFPDFLDPYIKANIPKVDFIGYVPEEDIARVFRMADVVVIPYFTTTGTSGVFHLACGYGRPIVASDLPEIREILAEGASALLVPPDNVKALKDGILKVLSDEKMAAKMSAQNLRFAQGESWGIVAQAYEEAYLELLTH